MKEISSVHSNHQIRETAKLAHHIWNQHFVPIIGQEQVDYMLDQFQDEEAISKQIKDGAEYYLLEQNTHSVGYLCLVHNAEENRLMISKIYLKKESRGTGGGNFFLEFAKTQALERNLKTIWLTVNRYNTTTIEWYKRKGFKVVDEVKKDIGQGYYMDDFIMELQLR